MAAPEPPVRTGGDGERVARESRRWQARSRRVTRLRRILPVIILVLAGGTVSWVAFRSVMSGVERRASQRNAAEWSNPMFHGQDDLGRAFVIGASGAVRDARTGRLRLVGPMLKLNLGGRRATEITAAGGTYDETRKTVIIGPDVRIVDGETGFILTTPEAVIDTRTGVVTGDKGVHGEGPLGTVTASAYAIHDQGRRIEFHGRGEDKASGVIRRAGPE